MRHRNGEARAALLPRVTVRRGMWERLEDRLLALQRDPERAARWFQVAYWISLAFVVLGVAIVAAKTVERW